MEHGGFRQVMLACHILDGIERAGGLPGNG
jgi:hypothetical protein